MKLTSGAFGPLTLPYVPGFEVAGVVESVGDGVNFKPSDEVYGNTGFGGGGFAEYALLSADHVARKPQGLSFADAAGLVVSAGTAYEGLVDRAGLKSGETVLITAASGGVGTAAVQIAVSVGARVFGVASAANHDYLLSLRASQVFDYNDPNWVKRVLATVPGGVDVLFDGAGGETRDQAVGVVREGGRGVFIVGPPAQLERGIKAESFAADINNSRLEAVGRLVEAGKLHAVNEAVLPLEQVREAFERVAAGHTRGKIVLHFGQ